MAPFFLDRWIVKRIPSYGEKDTWHLFDLQENSFLLATEERVPLGN